MLGSNCGVSDWESILKATKICDEYGIDTMNAGGCVAFTMECFEKGIIDTSDTGGKPFKFGNGDALVEILELIAKRKGIGDILAEGLSFAAERFNAKKFAIHSKGQAFAVYDPRGCKSMALTYATSPKGAHHMVATTMGHEINTNTRLEYEGKAELQRNHQFSMAIVDSLGLCATMRAGLTLLDQANAFSTITGLNFTEADLLECAERIINLERIYNNHIGFTRKDDSLPHRFLEEPISNGPNKGETVDLERLLDDFYALMGWTTKGIPTNKKLKELDLTHLITN
jgi:aldehyde:ferredoxin oxidoreductase